MTRLLIILLCLLPTFNETQEYRVPVSNLPDEIYNRMPHSELCGNGPLPSAGDVTQYWWDGGRWDQAYLDTICT